jgi:hypothetical protein
MDNYGDEITYIFLYFTVLVYLEMCETPITEKIVDYIVRKKKSQL